MVSFASLKRHKNCRTTIHQHINLAVEKFNKPGHDGSNPASVTASSDHAKVTSVEPDGVLDLSSGDVNLDTVVYLHMDQFRGFSLVFKECMSL